ncbi:RNA-directed DNA polymerase [Streptomyces sp. IBSBF 2390]|uniref:RNA-directed DNA polymerase n=1 Tax=Streptomyces sp. IBSBF 2390 TaxID=2903533 RepID=UPI003FA7E378
MLKCVEDSISPLLNIIYKDCIHFNYIPKSWRKVKVVFIPKSGKLNHSTAKDYRPISLSSFLLKIAERILDHDIRSLFNDNLISKSQHAYIKGKSVDTALHEVVEEAEKALHHSQFTLVAFLDIEGAFNNVTTDAIETSLFSIGVKQCLVKWIINMLNSRLIASTIGKDTTNITVNRGTPQGGVLSPLLWLLVVNGILKH